MYKLTKGGYAVMIVIVIEVCNETAEKKNQRRDDSPIC